MDVPLGDHVPGHLPVQVVVVPPQDLVGDVEVVVVVKLAAGDVEEPVEIAPLRQPEGGRKWCGEPPRLEKNHAIMKMLLDTWRAPLECWRISALDKTSSRALRPPATISH